MWAGLRSPRWRAGWLGAAVLCLLIGENRAGVAARLACADCSLPAAPHTLFLPLIARPDTFGQSQPIWPHAAPPAAHEVALFRRGVTTPALSQMTLQIFADTRYELWVDGVWLGRGPARFSTTTREYDAYALGDWAAGEHLIAVLVQWAPNYRRSESSAPMLLAQAHGTADSGEAWLARTGADWKALLSEAWRSDSPPVHEWKIVGPTEELDFSRLPADWMQPAFSDSAWPSAVVVSSTFSAYTPRSIPLLVDVPLTVTVREAGWLSPGRVLASAPAGETQLPFTLTAAAPFTLEVLSDTTTIALDSVTLDGQPLAWSAAPPQRPQVFVAHHPLAEGSHTLALADVPAEGLMFALPFTRTDLAPLNFGRRTLLAEPVSAPESIVITAGASLYFTLLAPPAYIVLELPRTVLGRFTAEVSGPAGTEIAIGWDERLYPGTARPLPYPGYLHSHWNQVDAWTLDGTPRTVTTIDARAGRYLLIAVWGAGPVTFTHARVSEERYPALQRGQFTSPNARLNQIWQVGVDSLHPNMNDAYTDTPWRERGQWWGDALVEDRINRAAFGDAQLLRRGLWLMAEKAFDGRPEPLAPNGAGGNMLDYDMLWVQTLADYWRRSGDAPFIHTVYPAVSAFMDYLLTYTHPTTGLLDIPVAHWWQTDLIDWAGGASRHGQSTALNAMYYGTLLEAAQLAEAVNDSASAQVWNQRAQHVRQNANQLLYQPAEGRYLTSILNGNPVAPTPHAQAWALAYGLTPDGAEAQVSAALLSLLSDDPASPGVELYGLYWVWEGLGRAGRLAEALNSMEQYYGRLLDLGATTWWEMFNSNLFYGGSLSHGWGGSPTWFLTTYVLGAQQIGPSAWAVKPGWASQLTQASGILPLPAGDLAVAWSYPNCASGQITVTAPLNTTGTVIVPFTSSTRQLTVNGNLVWANETPLAANVTSQPDGLRVELGAGANALVASQTCHPTYLPLVIQP